jgi:hypothetical protein
MKITENMLKEMIMTELHEGNSTLSGQDDTGGVGKDYSTKVFGISVSNVLETLQDITNKVNSGQIGFNDLGVLGGICDNNIWAKVTALQTAIDLKMKEQKDSGDVGPRG